MKWCANPGLVTPVSALLLVAGMAGCGDALVDVEQDAAQEEVLSIEAAATGSAESPSLEDVPGLGEPLVIDFEADVVSSVLVALRRGLLWPLVARRSSLDMTITSVNGRDRFHGSDVIPLTDVTLFDGSDRVAEVVVTWTEDTEPQVVGAVYTVCSTLLIELLHRTWSGPERCRSFGPFF